MQRACAATNRQAIPAHQGLGLEHACSTSGRQVSLPAPWPSRMKHFWCERAPWRRKAPRSLQCNGLEDGRYNADLARLMDGPDVTLFRFACLHFAFETHRNLVLLYSIKQERFKILFCPLYQCCIVLWLF